MKHLFSMFKEIQKQLKKDPFRYAPWLYLVVCILAYGLLIPKLGFYWDDWPTIFYTHSGRIAQLANHFTYDRPFSVWAYFLTGRLGTSPLTWHLAALLLRWATVVALGWALQPLWPRQPRKIVYVALLFAVYPGYYVQSLSVIFAAHLATYIALFVSLGAMGRALREPRRFAAWSALAIATCALQMFSLEYYVGLELMRPLYIWLVLRDLKPKQRQLWAQALKVWAPYAAVFAAWVAWRLFLFHPPVEPYPLTISHNPLVAALDLARIGLRDFAAVLFTTWVSMKTTLLGFLAGALAAGAVAFALTRLAPVKRESDERFAPLAALLGLLAFFAGLGPIWVIGETIAQGEYNQRYILIAMFGASLLLVSVICFILRKERNRTILIAILLVAAIGAQGYHAEQFSKDWEHQRSFYWQLAWRAPSFESNTALVTYGRLTYWTGEPLLGDALNTLYPPLLAVPYVDLWAFELTRTKTVKAISSGELLSNDYRGLLFSMQQPDDVVLYYMPPAGCLRVLTAIDAADATLPSELRELAPFSNPANILPTGAAPDAAVFGTEPARDWCYFYEKADLARQQNNWKAVIELMHAAQQQGLQPLAATEWRPFIEAYARTSNWDSAIETTRAAYAQDVAAAGQLCALWAQLPDNDKARAAVYTELACPSE
jgi:hypothetical protein